MTKEIIDMRCASCGKLLAKTNGTTEIVCPRCGAKNMYDAETGELTCEAKKKHRNTSSGTVFQ